MDQKTKEFIDSEINNNEVCLFMKGTPDAPQCGFSMAVSNILKILEVKFKGINVLENNELRLGIKEYSEWPTIPQLYIKKEFVGGCDIIKEMYENGELKKISQFGGKVDAITSKEGRKETINKLREEIKRAVKKERYLSKEDAKLISEFIFKIQKEINEAGN